MQCSEQRLVPELNDFATSISEVALGRVLNIDFVATRRAIQACEDLIARIPPLVKRFVDLDNRSRATHAHEDHKTQNELFALCGEASVLFEFVPVDLLVSSHLQCREDTRHPCVHWVARLCAGCSSELRQERSDGSLRRREVQLCG